MVYHLLDDRRRRMAVRRSTFRIGRALAVGSILFGVWEAFVAISAFRGFHLLEGVVFGTIGISLVVFGLLELNATAPAAAVGIGSGLVASVVAGLPDVVVGARAGQPIAPAVVGLSAIGLGALATWGYAWWSWEANAAVGAGREH
jgi:hypothetical protein